VVGKLSMFKICTSGVDSISSTFLRHFFAQKFDTFLANGEQIQQIFGHKVGCTVWGKKLVKLNDNFFAKRRAISSFSLAKKYGEIDPWLSFSSDFLNLQSDSSKIKEFLIKSYKVYHKF
jgi:hypothetical protein